MFIPMLPVSLLLGFAFVGASVGGAILGPLAVGMHLLRRPAVGLGLGVVAILLSGPVLLVGLLDGGPPVGHPGLLTAGALLGLTSGAGAVAWGARAADRLARRALRRH